MKKIGWLFVGLFFLMAACRSRMEKRHPVVEEVHDSEVVADTPPHPLSDSGLAKVKGSKPRQLPHLHDTLTVTGKFILFLRPNDARYAALSDDEENGLSDGDSDFGVGISGTKDSVSASDKYKDIQVLVTTKRYILITDAVGGPRMIDRDTVNYGYILSGSGMAVKTVYNEVHSGHYLGEIDEYFSIK